MSDFLPEFENELIEEIENDLQTGSVLHERKVELIDARTSLQDFTLYTKDDYQVNWHHKKMFEKLDKFAKGEIKRLIIQAPPRTGKLLDSSTKVRTTDGWKTHGDLRIGDQVFHPSGKPIKVLAISDKMEVDCQVTFGNGETVRCHHNHEWNLYDRFYSVWETLDTKTLMEKTHPPDRSRYLLPSIEALEFKENILKIHPYVLGVWLVSTVRDDNSITFDPKDRDEIVKYIEDHCDLAGDTDALLAYYGILETKMIPNDYMISSIEDRLQLLAGILDARGTLHGCNRFNFSSMNSDFIDQVGDLVRSLGWRTFKSSTDYMKTIEFPVHFISFTTSSDIPTVSKRKRPSNLKPKRRVGLTKIEEIPKEERTLGECIQVDSPDGLYLVGETLIPTHNSELVSRRLPSYIFGIDPDASIISCSYGADLASRMNRDVQRIMETKEYHEVFPDTHLWNKNVRATAQGSYLRNSDIFEIVNKKGVYRCSGVGGAITGMGGKFLILDDYFKNSEEAESETVRSKIIEWFQTTFYTRLEKEGSILITATRWNAGDIIGELRRLAEKNKDAEQWEVVSFPMVKETEPNKEDPREIDEVLWPDKYSVEAVNKIKIALGSKHFQALHQQTPTATKGNLVKREHFKFYRELPQSWDFFSTSWDFTFKDDKKSDYVVGQAWMKVGSKKYLVDQIRDRMGFKATLIAFIAFAKKYPWADEHLVEEKANGSAIIDVLHSKISGIVPINPTESKYSRVVSITPQIEAGNIYLPHPDIAPWVGDYIEEFLAFPRGIQDDQCFPAGELVTTLDFPDGKPIESIQVGEMVLTPSGFNPVVKAIENPPKDLVKLTFDDGTTLSCTENHPIYVPELEVYVEAGSLSLGVELCCSAKKWSIEGQHTEDIQSQHPEACLSTSMEDLITQDPQKPYTVKSGLMLMGRYLQDTTSTIKIMMQEIMNYPILRCVLLENMEYITGRKTIQRGLVQGDGRIRTERESDQNSKLESAFDARYRFRHSKLNSVQTCVEGSSIKRVEDLFPMNLVALLAVLNSLLSRKVKPHAPQNVSSNTKSSKSKKDILEDINQEIRKSILVNVNTVISNSKRKTVKSTYVPKNVKGNEYWNYKTLIEVKRERNLERVYNLEIANNPVFFINNILVKNCDATSQYLNRMKQHLGWFEDADMEAEEINAGGMSPEVANMFGWDLN